MQTKMGNWVVKVADTSIKYGYIWKFLDGSNAVDADTYTINSIGTNRNYLLNYSIGGISIDSMYGETQEANNMTLLTEAQLPAVQARLPVQRPVSQIRGPNQHLRLQ